MRIYSYPIAQKLMVATLLGGLVFPVFANAQQPANDKKVSRLIVKLKPNGELLQSSNLSSSQANQPKARLQAVVDRVRTKRLSLKRNSSVSTPAINMQPVQAIDKNTAVVALGAQLSSADAKQLMQEIAADKSVEYVETDVILQASLEPNDARYQEQWNFSSGIGGANLPAAWNQTTGANNIVVAVLDTGYLPHADVKDNLLPGYDFISDARLASNGGGLGSDGKDYGTYITEAESKDTNSPFFGYRPSASSWHGSHVAGIIGAAGNNGLGIAGISWKGKILPVRVLGKGGSGYLSDIAKGMKWAAGLSVDNAPANPYLAKVLNLSLGVQHDPATTKIFCSATMANAIKEIKNKGVSIVVAAGNSGKEVAYSEPASCDGVIAVSASSATGEQPVFSNYGSKVTISAPGVNILSTVDAGTEGATQDDYKSMNGTSMAAPHVSGTIALMLAINPDLTPDQIVQNLQLSARQFPAGTWCSTPNLCGAGLLDAAKAVERVKQGY